MVAPLALMAVGAGVGTTKTIVGEINKMNEPHRSGNVSGDSVGGRSFGLTKSKPDSLVDLIGAGQSVSGQFNSTINNAKQQQSGGNEMLDVITRISRQGLPQEGMINRNTDPIGSHI